MLDETLGSTERPPLAIAGQISANPVKFAVAQAGPQAEVILDISRLLSRIKYSAPTGVDRVEMAYAREFLRLAPERLAFAAVHPSGVYGRLPMEAVCRFLEDTSRIWSFARGDLKGAKWVANRVASLVRLMPRPTPPPIPSRLRPSVYLQVSPHHLHDPRRVARILERERARFVCLVHDLIPIEYPEHARPDGSDLHQRRMDTVLKYADAVIVASEATKRSFLQHAGLGQRVINLKVSPLGAEALSPTQSPSLAGTPYFVSVGTIEPRKNHLLLLNLWRRMAEEMGPRATPRLVLVGRRGWENENIIDMLDRCLPLKGVVDERGHLSDQEMWSLLQGARALLMPSFAEGFGLPVIEALQLGVPVLGSDIPAHREIAGSVAEFLDPLDGPAWQQMILEYAKPHSGARNAQLRRMESWTAPTWTDHVSAALSLIDDVAR
jgi:glycosyltransferase involved in cell wall biosynthesis